MLTEPSALHDWDVVSMFSHLIADANLLWFLFKLPNDSSVNAALARGAISSSRALEWC